MDAVDLIKKLTLKCPEERITISEALRHKWFKDMSKGEKVGLPPS